MSPPDCVVPPTGADVPGALRPSHAELDGSSGVTSGAPTAPPDYQAHA